MLGMFTGTEALDRQRKSMRSVPPLGGSFEESREFLTASPTPCSRCSVALFPAKTWCCLHPGYSRLGKSRLLQGGSIYVEPLALTVDDGCLPIVINLK